MAIWIFTNQYVINPQKLVKTLKIIQNFDNMESLFNCLEHNY